MRFVIWQLVLQIPYFPILQVAPKTAKLSHVIEFASLSLSHVFGRTLVATNLLLWLFIHHYVVSSSTSVCLPAIL